jgi:group I intron endonuclease
MFIIYKITNIINSKIYIGITTKCVQKRLKEHFRHSIKPKFRIHNAIKKHGKQNFIIEQIDTAECQNTANNLEKYWIDYYKSTNYSLGYNMSFGGSGKSIILSEVVKKKIKQSVQKHRDSLTNQEKKEMTVLANNAKRGKKESLESKIKKSKSQTERWGNATEEYRKEHGKRCKDNLSEEGKIKSLTALKNSYSPAREPGIKKPKIECPHCKKVGGAPIMKRYHFNNCKEK